MRRATRRLSSPQDKEDSPGILGGRFWWPTAAVALLGGALVCTWPLVPNLGQGIPLGTEGVATVPLFNLWTLWWNQSSLAHHYSGYWDAPIFHPALGTFALSEPQPLSGLLGAALVVGSGSHLAGYNLLLFGSVWLNGVTACGLLRRLGGSWQSALAAGFMVQALPFVHQEFGVLQLVPVWGCLLLIGALIGFWKEPGFGRGVAVGAALAVTYLSCAYYGLLGALILGPASLALARAMPGGSRRLLSGVAGAALAAVLLLGPVVLGQRRAFEQHGLKRGSEAIAKSSAQWSHYSRVPFPSVLGWGLEVADRPGARAFLPGFLKLALAGWAALSLWRYRPRLVVFGGLTLVGAVLLSLGPAGWIHPALVSWVPGLDLMRGLFRAAMLAQLIVVVFAALGLHSVASGGGRSARTLSLILAVLAVAEVWPPAKRLQPLPPLDVQAGWLEVVEASPPEAVFAFLPFPEGRSVSEYQATSQWMYWQMRHGRRMVNGYSGFFPRSFTRLKGVMAGFPSSDALAALRQAGVTYCVVAEREEQTAEGLRSIYRDDRHGVTIYRLGSRGPGH